MKVTVYHNPRCSKSRKTVKLLEEHQIDFDTILYLQDIPSKSSIKKIVDLLGFSSVRELMRSKEADYKAQQLDTVNDEAALLTALVKSPQLIERPIVVVEFDNGQAAAKIGRPPQAVLCIAKTLLNSSLGVG